MRDRPRRPGPADRHMDPGGDAPRAEGRAGVEGRGGRPAGLEDRNRPVGPERPATSADGARGSRPARGGGRNWLDKLPEFRADRTSSGNDRSGKDAGTSRRGYGGPRPDAGQERGWRPSAGERDHGGRQAEDTSPGRRADGVGPARRSKDTGRERRPDSDGPRPRDLQAFAKRRDTRQQGSFGPGGPDRRGPYRPWFYSEEPAEPWFLHDPDP